MLSSLLKIEVIIINADAKFGVYGSVQFAKQCLIVEIIEIEDFTL